VFHEVSNPTIPCLVRGSDADEIAAQTRADSGARSNVRLLGRYQRWMLQSEGLRDASAVSAIGAGAIRDMALLDVQLGIAHRACRVLEQHLR
jgi:hypothetical protein